MENTPSESGFDDVLVGTELFRVLKVGPNEFKNPQKMQQIEAIASYLNEHPDPMFELNRVVSSNKNPNFSSLEHLFSFVTLKKEEASLKGKMEQLKKQLEHYG